MPVRADDIQWMCRWSSPSSYSRRAWNATSPAGEASDVGPSRSLANPTGSGRSAVTRGWTHSVWVPVWTISRRIRPSRSDLTISAGPTVTTPRRAVGNVYTASVARPGPSGGMSRRSGRPPTCSSIVREAIGVRRGFVTRTTATDRSPTVTRSGSSVRSTSSASRPITNGSATSSTIRQPAATTISSTHPSSHPPTYAATPRTTTVQPLAVNGILRRVHGTTT